MQAWCRDDGATAVHLIIGKNTAHVLVLAADNLVSPHAQCHSRDSLAIVKARTLTPFDMSSGDAYSSGL